MKPIKFDFGAIAFLEEELDSSLQECVEQISKGKLTGILKLIACSQRISKEAAADEVANELENTSFEEIALKVGQALEKSAIVKKLIAPSQKPVVKKKKKDIVKG